MLEEKMDRRSLMLQLAAASAAVIAPAAASAAAQPSQKGAAAGSVEATLRKLTDQIDKLNAYWEVQNVMATYEAYQRANMFKECKEVFALKTADVAVEFPHMGRFEGPAEVRRWCDFQANIMVTEPKTFEGTMAEHNICTPYIVVADDGKTARAVWTMVGHETSPDKTAFWAWAKYACDFIKQDDGWKIWHMHLYPTFYTDYKIPWTEMKEMAPPPEDVERFHGNKPNGPFWTYNGKGLPPNLPALPKPYKTFDPKTGW